MHHLKYSEDIELRKYLTWISLVCHTVAFCYILHNYYYILTRNSLMLFPFHYGRQWWKRSPSIVDHYVPIDVWQLTANKQPRDSFINGHRLNYKNKHLKHLRSQCYILNLMLPFVCFFLSSFLHSTETKVWLISLLVFSFKLWF